ncbi:MAG: 3',5'-cyclic AMP phosphodiesterase CpdA [Limisphaerales bacterium]|jgi:3',5'-cyclic AMP phosphodiesterase CpdA
MSMPAISSPLEKRPTRGAFFVIAFQFLWAFAIGISNVGAAQPEEPLATIAVVSNPYITTLPAEQIVDENNRVRDFLAKTAPVALEKTVAIVNGLQPDALIVLGSATWSGSRADFDRFKGYLDRISVPKLVIPGSRDALSPESEGWIKELGQLNATDSVRDVAGVRLVFASDLHTEPQSACARIEEQLATTEKTRAHATLLFNAHPAIGRSKRDRADSKFWPLIEKFKIAGEFEATRYGARVRLANSLPSWTVGSTGWSTRGAITRIRVFVDRIEVSQYSDANRKEFALSAPNPVGATRFPSVENDPHGCLTYSAELKKKPALTVALISDPQFDRERNRRTLISRAEAGIADLNRLKPDLVFITGDLVNNNLPEEWELFNAIFAKLKPRRYVVPGNHDVLFNYDFIEANYSGAAEKKPDYATLVKRALVGAHKEGFSGPAALFEKFTGSPPRQVVEVGDTAFITVPFLTTRADPDQLDYLRRQLEATADKRHVFVAAHYPTLKLFGNNVQSDKGGSQVLDLLAKHKVAGFLFGHRHRNGFAMFQRTAHVLTDNLGSIHLLHIYDDHIVIGRKRIGAALYPTLTISEPRSR